MSILFYLLFWLLSIYTWVLIGRVIVDLIQMFARDWRPSGFLLVVCELIYTLTDPPVKLMRRLIPPLRLGSVALDLGFLLVFILAQVLANICLWASAAFA